MRRQRITFILSAVVIISLLLTGCLGSVGGGGSSTASLSGKITFFGEDFDGQVVIQVGDEEPLTVEGGSYTLTNLKATQNPVILSATAPEDGYVHYNEITLKSGNNTYDIDLVPKEHAAAQYLEAAQESAAEIGSALEAELERLQEINFEDQPELQQLFQSLLYFMEITEFVYEIENDGIPGTEYPFTLSDGATVIFTLDDTDGLLIPFPLEYIEHAKLEMEIVGPNEDLLGEGSLILYIDDQNDSLWKYDLEAEILGTEFAGTVIDELTSSIDFNGRISSELLTVNGSIFMEFGEGIQLETFEISGSVEFSIPSVVDLELNGNLAMELAFIPGEYMSLPVEMAFNGFFRLNEVQMNGNFNFETDPDDLSSFSAAFSLSFELPSTTIKLEGEIEQSDGELSAVFVYMYDEARIEGTLALGETPRLVLKDTVWPITITVDLYFGDDDSIILEGRVYFDDEEMENLRFEIELFLPVFAL